MNNEADWLDEEDSVIRQKIIHYSLSTVSLLLSQAKVTDIAK